MGYEIDFERVLEQARACRVFFEIKSSPDRLDLSADMARQAKAAVSFLSPIAGALLNARHGQAEVQGSYGNERTNHRWNRE